MSYALFIQHKTLPGKRPDVQAVWRKHMMQAVATNDGHKAYFYCFGTEPDAICAFQHYRNQYAATAFLKTPAYAAYLEEVTPLLSGEPVVTVLDVQWSNLDCYSDAAFYFEQVEVRDAREKFAAL